MCKLHLSDQNTNMYVHFIKPVFFVFIFALDSLLLCFHTIFVNYKFIFLIQKHVTKTIKGSKMFGLERINGISINFNEENCFEIRAI